MTSFEFDLRFSFGNVSDVIGNFVYPIFFGLRIQYVCVCVLTETLKLCCLK